MVIIMQMIVMIFDIRFPGFDCYFYDNQYVNGDVCFDKNGNVNDHDVVAGDDDHDMDDDERANHDDNDNGINDQ